ncbi:DMT family transporter [Bosea sp. 47.2.35]|uniref:DMT family transporter n=1 Tax=Bosea sp. 47.2.35 TaxID=2969304 RepID=UPI00214FCF37|nr:DMT family transporter [Bosea sp. 47.2.35]MCR4524198.1 DMT family transporter [Bosea sp. 47.2.35]
MKIAYLVATMPPLFWAGNFLIARMMRNEIPPIQMSFWRWLLAVVILVPFTWSPIRRDWSRIRSNLPFLVVLGAVGVTAFNCFIYTALHYTSVVNAALVNSLLPVVTVVLALVLLRQPVSLRRGLGILISLLGAALVIAHGNIASLGSLTVGRGDLLVFAGMSFWALYTVLIRRRPLGLHPLSLLGVTSLFGMLFHIPLILVEAGSAGLFLPGIRTWPAMLYFAVFPSILAYVFWNRSVAALGPATTGMFMHFMPVFSAALAAIFLGETLAWYHPVAFAIIIVGIVLATTQAGTAGKRNASGEPAASR